MTISSLAVLSVLAFAVPLMSTAPKSEPTSDMCDTTHYCDCRVEDKSQETCQEFSACSAEQAGPVEALYELAKCDTHGAECSEQTKFRICDQIIQSIEDPNYSPIDAPPVNRP